MRQVERCADLVTRARICGLKTDTLDATILAELLRLDGTPKAYIPPREVRDIRELLQYRASLVSVRVGIKNKIHAVLIKNGMDCPFSNVLRKSSHLWLKNLALRRCYRQEIDGDLRIAMH